jgi:chromosome segregation ATPase
MTAELKERRISILRRLRGMLLRQRDKFQAYLDLLEKEGDSIASGDVDKLQSQLELEKNVIAEIRTLKTVIDPLEDLYHAAYPENEESVPALKAVLEKMGIRMKERNARNRAALNAKMEELRREISGLRAWPHGKSQFAEVTPSLVDVTT